jgi:hypothetical protein
MKVKIAKKKLHSFFKRIKAFFNKKNILLLLRILLLIYIIIFFQKAAAYALDDDFSSLFGRDIRKPWSKVLTEEQIDFGFMLLNIFNEKIPNNVMLKVLAFNKTFLKIYIKNFQKNF